MATTPRRPVSPMDAAEALFKPGKKVEASVEKRAVPEARELVSLRLDSAVIQYFQDDGPGWQDRINDALRAVMAANPKD
ncbi:BrnA antitoxin family protein [Rhizobium sp. 0TCS1.26]|uniref:BrnA antitoxin family protein n=1 Tax=Rhizobium sp. 0TCS1.26 TaxID=3142623 RepID=UPI003D27679B